jgi:serine-type anaerobic sulfatase-maturating enzyme
VIKSLQLLIKPAGSDCNIACGYCFYRRVGDMHGEGAHRMSDEVLTAMIRRYMKLRMPQSVFAWQGGEPTLMGLPFFERAVSLMQQFGQRGQSVSNALQTNGILIDEKWCKFLRGYNFLVGLSLDGPPEIHDHYRVTMNDKGTHAEVLRAFKLMQQSQVEFNTLTVVNELTAKHAKTLYGYFLELGMKHMQFIPCIETDSRTLEPHPFSVTPEAYADFLCELFDCWKKDVFDCVSIRMFDGILNKELTGCTNLCYLDGTCGECPVIEYNGDVYPCDFFVEPEQKLGNILKTPLDKIVTRAKARQFRAGRFKLPGDCEGCEWVNLCRGGCMKDRERIGGSFDVPTWFCETYKRFFPYVHDEIKSIAHKVREMHPDRYPPLPDGVEGFG